MGLFEAHEEKKLDVRILERNRAMGKLDSKSMNELLKSLPDDADKSVMVNVDEINAKDNPVHIPRGLPALDGPARKNFEDMEFDADEANRSFEH